MPGRFERVDEGQPFAVVVDYSHTEDALRNAISVARTLNAKRVITLFGCGGDRDRAKRPLMGQVAGELSDLVVLTSDNPRSEEPLQIMNDVLVGLRRTEYANDCGARPRGRDPQGDRRSARGRRRDPGGQRATKRIRFSATGPFISTIAKWRAKRCGVSVSAIAAGGAGS